MDESNPFVITTAEGETADGGAEEPQVPHDEEDGVEHGTATTTTVAQVGNVEDLIPLCVKHANGPQINTATFGYDIAQMERRPWAEPGARQTDFFNYGFNETSWRLYCAMQAEGAESLVAKANEMLQRLQVAGDGGGPEGAAGTTGGDERSGGVGGSDNQPPLEASALGGGGAFNGGGGYDRRNNFRRDGPTPHHGGGPSDTRMFYKTKLCQRFAEGRCAKGSECNYAHGISELRSAPAGATGGPGGGSGYGPDNGQHSAPPQQQQPQGGGGGGGYLPPQPQYGMGAYQPGANMGPMPVFDANGSEGFHMYQQTKRARGDGEY